MMPSRDLDDLDQETGFGLRGLSAIVRTPEQREIKSEMAKRLYAEGRFGGAEFGRLGGQKKALQRQSLNKAIVEEAEKKKGEIARTLVAQSVNPQSRHYMEAVREIRSAGAELIKNERDDEREEREFGKLSEVQLNERFQALLAEHGADPTLPVIEVEAVGGLVEADVDADEG